MKNISKDYVNEKGENATVILTSDDNYNVNMNGKYTLANNPHKNVNRFLEKYRSSILGRDIGTKSSGFATVATFATIISIVVLVVLYFLWRF